MNPFQHSPNRPPLHRIRKRVIGLLGLALLLLSPASSIPAQESRLDWNRVRQIVQKKRAGQVLTASEQSLFSRALVLRRQRMNGRSPSSKRQATRQKRTPQPQQPHSLGLQPIDEMSATDRYKGEEGGLYGGGRNSAPESHHRLALAATNQIQPLDRNGNPDPNGKIVLISLGMSNTMQHFQTFMKVVGSSSNISERIVLVNGAEGGQEALAWSSTSGNRGKNPWDLLDQKLRAAGVTRAQVQAAWVLLAVARPAENGGDFPGHTNVFHDACVRIFNRMTATFPNLRIAYQTTRIYAGYASTTLNPEPYCYEYGFAVRRLIQEQIAGNPSLNADPSRGAVRAPVLYWGPYVWGDGTTPRHDGIVWTPEDMRNDGTHPSDSGRMKMSKKLLEFLQTDPTSRRWFAQR